MLLVRRMDKLGKITFKFFLSYFLAFVIAVIIVSFKLPEIKKNNFFSTKQSQVVIYSKADQIKINNIKIKDNYKLNNVSINYNLHFSRTQLIQINVVTFFFIFFIFLIKIKYFD